MKCPKCGTENRGGAKFCNDCGARLQLLCPACGASNLPTCTICPHCSHELGRPERTTPIDFSSPHSYTPKHLVDMILSSRRSMEGERKVVTVMFADVKGFTPWSEKLDPEDVHRIMSGCFSILLDEIHKVQGTINDFRGDGLMALFGAPIAHEDHAQRACYACLAIQQGLAAYSKQVRQTYGFDFKMRIGLNSGPVVVGVIGDDLRMDYSAQGDTANLAARMETSAEPGTVLISENTHKLAKDFFEFEPLGILHVKGREQPVAAYRLQDRAYNAKARSEREIYAEMVGRDHELQRLEAQLLKVVNGEGSVVNVVGEAGIGKSRLLAELKKKSNVVKRVTILEGRAISMGKTLAFHPIVDLLKLWAGIADSDSEAEALDKLETAVRGVHPEKTNEITPFVGALMGMKLTGAHAERVKGIEGEGLEKLIFKNVRELLIKGTELRPTVVVMEDLHWSDTSSIELLDRLYPLVEKHRIAFINLFRPGYFDGDGSRIAQVGKRLPKHYMELTIQPLDKTHSETLIDKMLAVKGFPHHVKRQIVERAGGNPFFLEEVMRSLIDEGALARRNGGFVVTEAIERVFIPPTINDVLMARIDRLEEQTRELVKVASVIGRSFFERILKDVADSIDNVDRRLAYLKDVQIIRDRIRMQEMEYLFKHALAQEAAYASTLLQQRKEIHLKVAESIERLFQDRLHEFYGILALHYSRADNLEKTEEYMVKAGEEALRSSASSEAITHFHQALQLYIGKHGNAADPDKVAQFERNIAIAYFNKGRIRNALPYFDRALRPWGRRPITSGKAKVFEIVRGLLMITLRLYVPWNTPRRMPDQLENAALDLALKRIMCLFSMDPMRALAELAGELRWSFKQDLSRTIPAASLYSTAALLLAAAGTFRIAGMLLNVAENLVDKGRMRDVIEYQTAATIHHFLAGSWDEIPAYDWSLIDSAEKAGLIWEMSGYLAFQGWAKAEQGEFGELTRIGDYLASLEDRYLFRTVSWRLLRAQLHISRRNLVRALENGGSAVSVCVREAADPFTLYSAGVVAMAKVLMGDVKGAEESLSYSAEIRSRRSFWPPFYVSCIVMAQFKIDLQTLEGAIGGDSRRLVSEYSKAALRSGKKALQNSAKCAARRTLNYRLMGDYYRLVGKQRKAFKWWLKSIKEGERLGARPDLSRTYFQVGKRLLEPHSTYTQINGIDAKGYLDKAETLFREMDLQKDLEEMEQVRMRIGRNRS